MAIRKSARKNTPDMLILRFLSRRISAFELCELRFGSDDELFDYADENYSEAFRKYIYRHQEEFREYA